MIKQPKKVLLPSKHYVGMQDRGTGLPLGFITPWGIDAAAKKRMSSVDSWAGGGYYGRTKKLEPAIIDNIPMVGFRLTKDIRTGQYGAVDKWRIEDPRGFELEITSPNLAELLSLGTFEKGEILDQCLWGRDGANNVLVSIESEIYKEAVVSTQIANSTASWKDVKIGHNIVLQNGVNGVYLGKYHTLTREYHGNSSKEIDSVLSISKNLMHAIHSPTTTATYPNGILTDLHFIASPSLSQITATDELSIAEAELKINEYLTDKTCNIIKTSYNYPILAVANVIKESNIKLSFISDPNYDMSKLTTAKNNHEKFGLFRTKYHPSLVQTSNITSSIVFVSSSHEKDQHLITIVNEGLISTGKYVFNTTSNCYQSRYPYAYRDNRTSWKEHSIKIPTTLLQQIIIEKIDLKLEFESNAKNKFELIIDNK